ncbi:MAG: O-methyltransferase [Thermodesulfobacteriota bacterium]
MADTVKHPETYFSGLVPKRDEILQQLEKEAKEEGIPIAGPVVGQLLFVLARAAGAANILELGAAHGYSAIYLGRACTPGGRVVTLENDSEMAQRARENIEKAGLSNIVSVKEQDALESLAELEGPIDLVFMDIEKKDYRAALDLFTPLVRPGGLLVADNTAFVDAKGFNGAIYNASEWQSVQIFSYLPMHSAAHDGICLAVRMTGQK